MQFYSFFRAKSKLLFLMLTLSYLGCQSDTSDALIPEIERVVDLSENENFFSSIIESSRIIKLETPDGITLGSIRKIVKTNSLFFVNTTENELLLFNNNGSFLHKIGMKGRGPGEYNRTQDFAVNKDGSVVAICSLKDIYFYEVSDGSFIKKANFEYYINSLVFINNNDELLAQSTQTDFVIAHIDSKGNTINTFGSMNLALELELAIEFIELDESNYIYKIGQTTDYYNYNLKEQIASRNQIFEHKNALREQDLHEQLLAQGNNPLAYSNLRDYFNSHYRIMYLKKLNSNFLIYYLYEEDYHLLLYNWKEKTKKEFIFGPEESGNLKDDIMYLPSSVLAKMRVADSDDNKIITFISAHSFLQHFEGGIPSSLGKSRYHKQILNLTKTLRVEDNPLLIEYSIKEI